MMRWALATLLLLTSSLAAQTYRAEADRGLFHRTLWLRDDRTYEMRQRGGSCWFFSDESGTWLEAGGVITLRAVVVEFDTRTEVQGTMSGDRKEIHVEVRDEEQRPLANASIALNDGPAKLTDEQGRAVFDRSALTGPLEWLRAVHENTSINSRVEDADDTFHVRFDRNGILRQRIRLIELRRVGQTLVEQGEAGFIYRPIAKELADEDE